MAMSFCQSAAAVLSSPSRAAVHAAMNSATVKGSSLGLPGREYLKEGLEDAMLEVAFVYGVLRVSVWFVAEFMCVDLKASGEAYECFYRMG